MSSEDHMEILETKRLEIVKSLNCQRTLLLNYLRCKQVFDQEDCELILAEKTNDSRAGKLVDFLVKKGSDACQHFFDVIQVENAALYESLTGMKSTSKPSPLMKELAVHNDLNPDGGSSFEVQLLSEHLHRMYGDLQDISKKYSLLLKKNRDLEERLVKADKNLEFELERRQQFETRVSTTMEADEDAQKNEELLYRELDDLRKGVADRDVYIIVLQMKLLAEKEECEKLRSKIHELEDKNETISRDLHRVSENYNHERCQSMKLSECIRLQVDEIHKMDELKKRLRESQFQNILIRDERDCKADELQELKKWAEALKTRFDIVEKEKHDFLEKNEIVTSSCDSLREKVRSLERKLALADMEVEDCKRRMEMLAKDCEIYKKQRDCALDARKEAIVERDQAISEKDTIRTQYIELQTKRDQINEERATLIQDYDALEIRYKATLDELSCVKRELNEKELEAGDLSRLLNEAREKNRRSYPRIETESSVESDDERHRETDAELVKPATEGDPSKLSPWRERRLNSLLKSMKLRISGERAEGCITKDPVVSPVSAGMTLEVLQYLLPNLTSHPYGSPETVRSTTISRTLQRQMGLRRQAPVDKNSLSQENSEPKARSLPCFNKGKNGVDFMKDAEKPLETNPTILNRASSHDPTCTQDFNTPPDSFRKRAKLLSKRISRSRSTSDQY